MYKISTLLLFLTLIFPSLHATNPLSKIQITSQSATCQKQDGSDGKILFTYEKKVNVTLADKSTIKAGKLDIILDESVLRKKDTTVTHTHHPSRRTIGLLRMNEETAIHPPVGTQAERMTYKPVHPEEPDRATPLKSFDKLRKSDDGRLEGRRTVEKITFEGNVEITKGHRLARANRVEVIPESNECHLYGNVVIKQLQKKKQIPIVTRGEHGILNLKTHRITLVGSEAEPVNTTIFLGKRQGIKKSS